MPLLFVFYSLVPMTKNVDHWVRVNTVKVMWTYKCARKPDGIYYNEIRCCFDDDGYKDCRRYTFSDLSNSDGYLDTHDYPAHGYCNPVVPGTVLCFT